MDANRINTLRPSVDKITTLLLGMYSLLCLIPVVVVVSVSFSTESAINESGYGLLPRGFSLAAYQYVLNSENPIARAYAVTLLTTAVGSVLSLLFIAMFAYPLYRKDFKHRNLFSFILFVTMIFNGGLVPWYLVCSKVLNLRDNILALIVPYVFNAFYVLIMRTFYTANISEYIVESAKIDGAGEGTIFFRIILPLSKPGLATIGLFATIHYWNDWFLPLMLISNADLYNLQFLIYKILTNISVLRDLIAKMGESIAVETPDQTARMAMCVLTMGPVIFAYPFFQKYFVKGLTIGAVKG